MSHFNRKWGHCSPLPSFTSCILNVNYTPEGTRKTAKQRIKEIIKIRQEINQRQKEQYKKNQ